MQVLGTALSLLSKGGEVAREVTSCLLPVLAVWLLEEDTLVSSLLEPLLQRLEATVAGQQGVVAVGGQLDTLESLLPFLGAWLLQDCPGTPGSCHDCPPSPLPPALASTLGSALLPSWTALLSLPSLLPPWPHLTSFLPLLTRLLTAVQNLPLSSSSFLSSLLTLLGPEFGSLHLLPLISSQVSLSPRLLPLLISSLLSCPPPLCDSLLPLLTAHLSTGSNLLEPRLTEAISQVCSCQ